MATPFDICSPFPHLVTTNWILHVVRENIQKIQRIVFQSRHSFESQLVFCNGFVGGGITSVDKFYVRLQLCNQSLQGFMRNVLLNIASGDQTMHPCPLKRKHIKGKSSLRESKSSHEIKKVRSWAIHETCTFPG